MCPFSPKLPSYPSDHITLSRVLPAGPCWFSILDIAVCTCPSRTPCLSPPPFPPSSCNHKVVLLSLWVTFYFVRSFVSFLFSSTYKRCHTTFLFASRVTPLLIKNHPVPFSDFTPCRKRIFKTTGTIKAAVLKFLKVSVSENVKDLKACLGNLLSLRCKDKNSLETSLVVQWLRRRASTAGVGIGLIPGWELRSRVLCSMAKKKEKSEKKS